MNDSLIERMTEIAHRDSAVSVTVRADDLRALLSKLRTPVADERVALRVGNLPTMSQEEYPGLGDWWVQLWHDGEVFARVYGSTPQQAKDRAIALASAPVAGEAVAWKVYDAGLNKHMLTDNPKVADMLRAEGGGNVVRPLVYGDNAPQASECECARRSKAIVDSEAKL